MPARRRQVPDWVYAKSRTRPTAAKPDTSYAATHPVKCAQPKCAASHPGSKWDAIAADAAGWFHAADGSAYCPDHVPSWVAEWRTSRRPAPSPNPPESEK